MRPASAGRQARAGPGATAVRLAVLPVSAELQVVGLTRIARLIRRSAQAASLPRRWVGEYSEPSAVVLATAFGLFPIGHPIGALLHLRNRPPEDE